MWIRRKGNMRNINVSQVFCRFSLAKLGKVVKRCVYEGTQIES